MPTYVLAIRDNKTPPECGMYVEFESNRDLKDIAASMRSWASYEQYASQQYAEHEAKQDAREAERKQDGAAR